MSKSLDRKSLVSSVSWDSPFDREYIQARILFQVSLIQEGIKQESCEPVISKGNDDNLDEKITKLVSCGFYKLSNVRQLRRSTLQGNFWTIALNFWWHLKIKILVRKEVVHRYYYRMSQKILEKSLEKTLSFLGIIENW